ncbi:MAG: response regulator transcription factor [Chloroflexota bacterium]
MLRILIADDHSVVRAGLKILLDSQEDMEVVGEAGDGEEAVRLAAQYEPDVVVMDIRMPGLSGIEACQRIKDTTDKVNVIVLTSYAEDDLLSSAIDAGASGYVLKRIGNNDLVTAVRSVGNGDGVLDPALTAGVFSKVREANKAQSAAFFADLTQQELSVLALLAQGLSNRQIAAKLYLGEGTVRNYVSNILSKIEVKNRAEAAIYAVKHNIEDVAPPLDTE